MLPDDVLLEIFDFFVVGDQDFLRSGDQPARIFISKRTVEWWQPLVHVCRRWRGLVFRSPRRLNLQLYCTLGSVTRKTLDVWPPLPLLIMNDDILFNKPEAMDDLPSALEHNNRVRQISLSHPYATASQIEKVWAAMQVPFPELTALRLELPSGIVPVVPDSFLGGSAPRLQLLAFAGIPFPGLQNYFYLPLTSSNFTFGVFLIPGTFHPRRWSLASPC